MLLLFYMSIVLVLFFFFFSSRRRHTRFDCDWSSDVCSSDLTFLEPATAYWAWTTFNLLCLAAALFFLIREIGPPGADGWTVGALMLLYPPIALNFWFAQSEVVLLLIF